MTLAKELIKQLEDQGIGLTLVGQNIKLTGCVTNEQRNLVKLNKEILLSELQENLETDDSPSMQEHFEALGWDKEHAELLTWSWIASLPKAPFELLDGYWVGHTKAFYRELGEMELQGPTGEATTSGKLKAILLRLKEIVENEQVAA